MLQKSTVFSASVIHSWVEGRNPRKGQKKKREKKITTRNLGQSSTWGRPAP